MTGIKYMYKEDIEELTKRDLLDCLEEEEIRELSYPEQLDDTIVELTDSARYKYDSSSGMFIRIYD